MVIDAHPTISVIVPNYNHEAFIELRIESILAQTYQDFELILLDDRSPDASAAVINKYRDHPKVSHILINEVNSGSTFRQWERGLSVAVGMYCWIAESDDYADPEFLAGLLPFLREGAGLAYCNSRIVDANGASISTGLEGATWLAPQIAVADFSQNYVSTGIDEIRRHLLYSNTMYNASAILVRTEILRSVLDGLSKYRLYGDWLAWIRCCLRCDTVAYLAAPLNNFRTHSGNVRSDMSRRYELQLQESIAMRDAIAQELPAAGEASAALLRINRHEARNARQSLLRDAANTLGSRFALRLLRTHAPAELRDPAIWKALLFSFLRRLRRRRS